MSYPRHGGANAVFWIAEDALEVEPLSCEHELAPGESALFAMRWVRLTVSDPVNAASPPELGRWIERELAALVGRNR
jgi:hypothetical protein